jgi:hypothetical protein
VITPAWVAYFRSERLSSAPPLEHGKESAFDLGEEDLRLPDLIRALGKRGFVNDAQTGEALFDSAALMAEPLSVRRDLGSPRFMKA